jgi:tetratricopeptide (TPR) repeat protein
MSLQYNEEYDFFVSYYERVADDLAERVYDILTKDFGYRVYANHIIRDKTPGDFELNIDKVIQKCKVFVLINSRGALSRNQVIREIKVAFPEGDLLTRELWIFREKSDDVPFGTEDFKMETNIDLKRIQQSPFVSPGGLGRAVHKLCQSRKKYITPSSRTAISPGVFLYTPRRLTLTVKATITDVNIDQLREEAKTYLQNEEYMKALDKYNQILDITPSDIAAVNEKGITLAKLRRFKEAEDEFSGAIYLSGLIPGLWSNKALVLHLQNKEESALRDIGRAIFLSPNKKDKDLMFSKATILFGLGRYDDSRKSFDEVLSVDPKFTNAISGKAASLDRLGNIEESLKLFHRAIDIDSSNDNAWYNLGVIYERNRKYDEALLHYNRSIELNPHNYNSYTNKGRILRISSRNDEALEAYDKAIDEWPESAQPYFNKGTCLGLMLKFEESLVYLEKALERDPDSISALNNKAESSYQLQRFEDALATVNKLLDQDSRNVNALKIAASIYYEKSMFPEAEQKFKEVYELERTDFNTVHVILELFRKKHKYDDQALQFCNDALSYHPRNIFLLLFRSHVLIKLQRLISAIEDCDLVIELDKDEAAAYYNKGCAKALLSNEEEAIQLINKSISLDKKCKELAQNDMDLISLRHNPEFNKILT